jgi:hypothetical protein
VRLITNSRFHRLMPDAYSESMEILRAIERLRPDWLRETPHLHFFDRLTKDWTRRMGGIWIDWGRSPQKAAAFLEGVEAEMIEAGKLQTDLARKEMIEAGWKSNPRLDKTFASFSDSVPGWSGDSLEAWRVERFTTLTNGLARFGNAHRDWIAPFVELDDGLLESPAWGQFWFYLVDKNALPRQWIRWAYSFAQRFRKPTQGAPGDVQLSTYFLETDVVATADKALLAILEECRPYAPCKWPEGKLLLGGEAGVVSLFQLLET